jgi:DNA-binding MarR family transcriptional regulator
VERTQLSRVHAAIACLQRMSQAFQERRRQLAKSVNLTEQQWEFLEQISSEHFMPTMFAKRRASSAAAVSKVLRQLVDKRLVVAHVATDDARQRRYRLTARGKRTMETLRRERMAAIDAVWVPLGAGDLDAFIRFGNRLLERLGSYALARRGRN